MAALFVGATVGCGPVEEANFYGSLVGTVCDAYLGCCTQRGWTPSWRFGHCDADGTAPQWILALGAHFVPENAPACMARVREWLGANLDCAASSNEYTAYSLVSQLCPELYAGGRYRSTPLGYVCTGIDTCAPSPEGPTDCVLGILPGPLGASLWQRCVVRTGAGVEGDVCGSVACPGSGRTGHCVPLVPPSPRVAWQCAPGLYCDGTYHCAARVTAAAGGACTSEISCEEGTYCAGSGPGRGVCAPDAGEGSACVPTPYQQGAQCAAGLSCGAGQVCSRPPVTVARGQACDGVNRLCASSDHCDTTNGAGVCAGLLGGGASCVSDVQCGSRRCLNGRCTVVHAPLGSDCE